MTFKLSDGALEIIMSGGDVKNPVMQVLASKKLVSANSSDRYRLLISDGRHLNSFAMVATQLNDLVVNGDLSEFTIIQINKYITTIFNNPDKDKRVMVILELDILKKGSEVGVRIGNPKSLDGPPKSIDSGPTTNGIKSVPQVSKPTAKANISQIKTTQNVGPIHPISSLSPYQNKWSIKARVTNKQPIRTYTNARGEGKLFSVVFTDKSGEIKCTGFNSAVDKFADLLELNKVYIVSNCSIKPANKKFTQADYEMTFNDDSIVTPCCDEGNLPNNLYNFTPISKIAELDIDSIIDVIGVAKYASELQTLTARSTGKELKKREVTLVEPSKCSISLTLWGQQAVDFDASKFPVVAAKGVRVSEFMGGRSISVLMSSTLQMDPDMPEAYQLRGWFDSGGASEECVSLSAKAGTQSGGSANFIWLGELASQGIGLGDKADYFNAIVNVLMAKSENCVYKACPVPECKKKVMDMNNGLYRCEKCNRDHSSFTYRLLLSIQVSDFTGSTWVTLFNEEAEKILGAEAETIGSAIDSKDESYKEYFMEMNFKKFQMKFRTKMESYNDEKRLKTTVASVDPVNYQAYARRLLDQFKEKAGMVRPGYK